MYRNKILGFVFLLASSIQSCRILYPAISPAMSCDEANARTDKITRGFQLVNDLLDSSQHYSPWDEDSDIKYMLHDSAFSLLDSLLQLPAAARYPVECLLPSISISSSPDKRLWIFQIDENTGGSFYSYCTLWHTRNKNASIVSTTKSPGMDEYDYWCGDVGHGILQQVDTLGQTIYLVESAARTCNTCYYWGISAWRLDAFGQMIQLSDIGLDSRMGSSETFYDPNSKTITLNYQMDDLNGGHFYKSLETWKGAKDNNEEADEEQNENELEESEVDYTSSEITEVWKFDGVKFILTKFVIDGDELQK